MQFGARAFAVAGPMAWNQLLAHLRALETVVPFKTALKTPLHPVTVPNCLAHRTLVMTLFMLWCYYYYYYYWVLKNFSTDFACLSEQTSTYPFEGQTTWWYTVISRCHRLRMKSWWMLQLDMLYRTCSRLLQPSTSANSTSGDQRISPVINQCIYYCYYYY